MLDVIRDVQQFGLGETKRKYIVVTLPFETARKFFTPERYSAQTGEGEQRELVMSHVKMIKKEIEIGNFTPTSVSVGLRDEQRNPGPGCCLEWIDAGKVRLKLQDGSTVPMTDGQHRFEAFTRLLESDEFKEDIEKSSVTALVMLDGSTKKDFLNLQRGRPVDKSHLHSLSVQEEMLEEKHKDVLTLAYKVARELNSNDKSPFFNQIRFDSSGVSGIPVSSLSGKGASDIVTSLVGSAKIAIDAKKDSKWIAGTIITAYTYLKAKAPELLEAGMKLCPPPNGTKGSATILIAVGNLLAYRASMKQSDNPDTQDVEALVDVSKKVLAQPVKGNFSGPMKRNLMGDFAEKFFKDFAGNFEFHYGVPTKLVELLSTSTFSVPKILKKRGRKKKEDGVQSGDGNSQTTVEEKATKPTGDVFDEGKSSDKPVSSTPVEDDGFEAAAAAFQVEEKAPWDEEFEG